MFRPLLGCVLLCLGFGTLAMAALTFLGIVDGTENPTLTTLIGLLCLALGLFLMATAGTVRPSDDESR